LQKEKPNVAPERKNRVTEGGVWLVSGGGRGITAYVALELAERHRLKLVLLGTTPHPNIDAKTRELAAVDRSSVRRETMRSAQAVGQNPIEAWRNMEKAIEIDATLQDAARRKLEVVYRCVDVSDAKAVCDVVESVRAEIGSIRGVLHGAGSGQDARFDRKRPEKVAQCIGSKVDGCVALYQATKPDPLEWFIGFGSISGRFGANGHTDYSLANDMLAKCVSRVRVDRPDVRCVTFHWHAWGDIGMAAKPEAKLALEMIGMQFMPAKEGLKHFLDEIDFGGDESEVLITDRNYIRKFFPNGDTFETPANAAPMLCSSGLLAMTNLPARDYVVTLNPITDRFLAEHRVMDRPTLPVVMALEMMAEAAGQTRAGAKIVCCRDVVVRQAIKFATQDSMAVQLHAIGGDLNDNRWAMKADVRRKDGRMVEEGRTYFEASFVTASRGESIRVLKRPNTDGWDFNPLVYPEKDAPVFHGAVMRTLRSFAIKGDQIVGKIAAPSPLELVGENRGVTGWVFPVAAFDAVLYAAGVLAYHRTGRGSLPVSFAQIDIGRLPKPGEPLWVSVQMKAETPGGLEFEAELGGQNDEQVLSIRGYQLRWLS